MSVNFMDSNSNRIKWLVRNLIIESGIESRGLGLQYIEGTNNGGKLTELHIYPFEKEMAGTTFISRLVISRLSEKEYCIKSISK